MLIGGKWVESASGEVLEVEDPAHRRPVAEDLHVVIAVGTLVERTLMPSRRQSSAIEVSPRRPSSTMRIFSSAAWCFRVARRMLRTSVSDDAGASGGASPANAVKAVTGCTNRSPIAADAIEDEVKEALAILLGRHGSFRSDGTFNEASTSQCNGSFHAWFRRLQIAHIASGVR